MPLARAYADGIFNGDDENTSVAYLAGMRRLDDGLHCFLHILFAHHDGNQDSFNRTGIIHHATVDTSLACFANASYIVVGKPFDVGFEQRVLYVLELGLTDNSLNFLHCCTCNLYVPIFLPF